MGQRVVADDFPGVAPAEEVGVNLRTVFMMANGAFTGVAGGIGVGDLAAPGAEDLVEFHFGTPFFLRLPGSGIVGCLKEPDV